MCVPIYLQGSARVPAPASLWSEPSEIRDVIFMLLPACWAGDEFAYVFFATGTGIPAIFTLTPPR